MEISQFLRRNFKGFPTEKYIIEYMKNMKNSEFSEKPAV